MNPIYFPFTYVPQWVAETLAASFTRFIVYQPSGKTLPAEIQTWVEKEAMQVYVPVPADDETFTKVVRAFQAFARLHADGKNLRAAAFWGRQGGIPLYDDTATSQIVAALKKDQTADSKKADSDSLLQARVFLDFAQEFDRQNAELIRGLELNDRRSKELLKNLSADKDSALPGTPLTAEIRVDDPGEYMTPDRLQAWIELFMEDPADSELLVTSSPSVFNHLIENLPTAEMVFDSKALPAAAEYDNAFISWREEFLNQIKQLVESEGLAIDDAPAHLPRVDRFSAKPTLTLYRLPDCRPADLFAHIVKTPNVAKNKSKHRAGIRNALLGLIRRQH